MQPVQRSEILDYVTYDEQRPTIRASVLAAKAARRILLGEHFAFLFENRDTVRYQVHEMMRTERIVREADIQHELDTYNELLGGPGELGCTLLVGIEDPGERDRLLTRWLDLPGHLYVITEGGAEVRATWDPRQVGQTRLSSVQYLKFPVAGRVPTAVGVDHPELTVRTDLSPETQAALAADLRASASSPAR